MKKSNNVINFHWLASFFSYPRHASFMLEQRTRGATDTPAACLSERGSGSSGDTGDGCIVSAFQKSDAQNGGTWRRWKIPKMFRLVGLPFVPWENWIPKTDWHNVNVQYVPAGATYPVLLICVLFTFLLLVAISLVHFFVYLIECHPPQLCSLVVHRVQWQKKGTAPVPEMTR